MDPCDYRHEPCHPEVRRGVRAPWRSGTMGPWDNRTMGLTDGANPPSAVLWSYCSMVLRSLFIAIIGFSSAAIHAQEPAKLRIAELNLGFSGAYKLGCWTQAEVVVEGGAEPFTGVVEIIARDPDGVTTSVFTPPDRSIAVVPGQTSSTRLFVRFGQDGAAIRVRLLDDSGEERARRDFFPGPEPGDEVIRYGLPATNRVFAAFGMRRGLAELSRGEPSADDMMAVRTVTVENAADLPLEWYGYEGIDTLVLGSGQPELYRPLASGRQRMEALVRWVELGGRVVLFCGADAPELIGPDGPLAPLVPGAYDTMTTLRETPPIEAFANSEAAIDSGRLTQLQVPRLKDVQGRVLAADAAGLPLVVRARRGLGEITFVAVDPDAPPLADWPGRANLLRQSLQWPAQEQDEIAGQQEDLVDRLRRALDGSFVGVTTMPFGWVALFVILYILLIGPGDYFFVKRMLKRMELTWLTFPLIVAGVSAAAYWAAHYMKGDQLRVNQVEIVDVDLDTGNARGTVWTHFFSPHVDRYDLTLAPRFGDNEISIPSEPRGLSPRSGEPQGSSLRSPERLVGWLGATGYGLDGMQGRRSQTGLFERGYAFTPQLDAMVNLPVQEWSTKTLVGRWSAELIEPIDAKLQGLDDDLLAGHITNRTGVQLEGCLLLHGNWAYRLPDLADGAVATIDDTLQPAMAKTALTYAGPSYRDGGSNADAVPRLEANTSDVDRLAMAMMFYETMGGFAYAQTPHRYQSFVDMSRLLRGNQAVLIARAKAAGSHWTRGETSLASDQDRRWVYYRFVIPLAEDESVGP
jgi:hypothetical protein